MNIKLVISTITSAKERIVKGPETTYIDKMTTFQTHYNFRRQENWLEDGMKLSYSIFQI